MHQNTHGEILINLKKKKRILAFLVALKKKITWLTNTVWWEEIIPEKNFPLQRNIKMNPTERFTYILKIITAILLNKSTYKSPKVKRSSSQVSKITKINILDANGIEQIWHKYDQLRDKAWSPYSSKASRVYQPALIPSLRVDLTKKFRSNTFQEKKHKSKNLEVKDLTLPKLNNSVMNDCKSVISKSSNGDNKFKKKVRFPDMEGEGPLYRIFKERKRRRKSQKTEMKAKVVKDGNSCSCTIF